MSGMGFNAVSDVQGLAASFGAADSVAFEMGTDGVASSIPGLGQTAIEGPSGMDGSTLGGLDF